MDALYQSTVFPAAAVALTTALPLPQIADGVATVGAAGSGLTVTVTVKVGPTQAPAAPEVGVTVYTTVDANVKVHQ